MHLRHVSMLGTAPTLLQSILGVTLRAIYSCAINIVQLLQATLPQMARELPLLL